MQIVIDIPDDFYERVQDNYRLGNGDVVQIPIGCIANGTPLPKGHGRLTDLDEIINFTYNTYGINSGKCITKDNEDIIDYIYNKAETIIEADKAESEG